MAAIDTSSPGILAGVSGVRMVEYTAGYVADHWCRKGHRSSTTVGATLFIVD